MSSRRLLLVLDTATRQPVLALAQLDGQVVAEASWLSGHRHGEELLPRLDELLANAGARPADLVAIAAGTGPGSFTGLRIGLATAKVLAYSLAVPLVGVATTRALGRALAAEHDGLLLLALPAGARDMYVARLRVGPAGVEELGAPQLATSFRDGATE
ncbi:MAG: tRNA (adenosine(37)-N6)-threonylcarbamoyltransferase complex dimerization subunit type 1 TsaB, partial [Chloroflexota bacterium]|nr:tRNA (adenosine(37)-N6)-threonylcarbamoyltransferase complex dimerization subunit type 1 TsaB [Chloroflexota bacterium]